MVGPLTLGLNQYTHTASCLLLAADGSPLFGLAKERVTRKKHHGGDVSQLVEYALESAGAKLEDIGLVVANNHLFPIRPFEQTLEWTTALHQQEPTFLSPLNLLPQAEKWELSHHLAHAWSVLPQAPFDSGLIVVMDGIGNTLADMQCSDGATDLTLPEHVDFRQIPAKPDPHQGWREAETVFRFHGLQLERIFKRWTQERTPTFLYNYGFENMDSLGALYSRIASHVFGDWNGCGKIMGLAPWHAKWNGAQTKPPTFFQGQLENLKVDWEQLHKLPHPHDWENEDHRPDYAAAAAGIQADLEKVALEFFTRLREESGEKNLCLVGGVALNSTLNGKILRQAGFEKVFIPPWPGDDGIAVGCALYGWHQKNQAPPSRKPIPPYLGRAFSNQECLDACQEFLPWVRAEEKREIVADTALALSQGQVVAWFQGRSELGPRALGNRSILATPAEADMVERINSAIKKREGFRPFAPTVLSSYAAEYFEFSHPSPYMSQTVVCRPDQRAKIPAVVHIDGTSRIQTLEPQENPLYHQLISAFQLQTSLPMVLNTSFNIKGEPIVETPADALRAFLDSDLDALALENQWIQKRPFPSESAWETATPRRIDAVTSETVADADGEPMAVHLMAYGQNFDSDALELGVLEACDGENTISQLQIGFTEEWEVPAEETIARLQRLWDLCLVHFG